MLSEIPSVDELIQKGKDEFFNIYKEEPELAVRAPGRINIIGDHSDYNDGFVMPIALPLVTVIVGRRNGTSSCNIATLANLDEDNDGSVISFRLPSRGEILRSGSPQWANYIKGVVAGFPFGLVGFDMLVNSSVPIDCGLASSSALEVAMFTFLEELTGTKVEIKEKALLCQRAENEIAGLPCGVMDQMASSLGEVDRVILIDCKSLKSKLYPFQADQLAFLITDSNVRHKNSGCEYPQRRIQCQTAATLLGEPSLRTVGISELGELQNLSVDQETIDRAHHVIFEMIRTVEASRAIENSDFKKLGRLMNESHDSLRDFYKVSCDELDSLVNIARSVNGVLGSRMAGEGFGGCTITLLYRKVIEQYMNAVLEGYNNSPAFYVCRPADGPRAIKL